MTTNTTDSPATTNLTDVAPDLLKNWLGAGDTILVDVREDFEHASERIDGAVHHALSKFDADALRAAHPGKRIVFHCRSGKRSADAASRFANGSDHVFHLQGGIEGWKAAGEPVIKPAGAPRIGVMRQVQMVAGFLVALGVTLGVLVNPWFLAISGFVGCGLMFAGLTGWCGMAMLLGAMPWNKVSGSSSAPKASCCSA